MSKGLLIIISGPSGSGKGTVLNEVFGKDDNLSYSVSCTTRDPRPGEVDGQHYHFITRQQFDDNIRQGKMLEYAEYCGNLYGTNAEYVESQRALGKDVVLEIETCGATKVKDLIDDALMIFIAPPSIEELRKRLTGRETEPQHVIDERIKKAIEELTYIPKYDYLVINEVPETAADDVLSLIRSKRLSSNKEKYKNKFNYNL